MKLSQIEKVAGVLARNTTSPGVTASKIARDARVPVNTVYKRIHDLRSEGVVIYSNTRNVNGQSKTYYRLDAQKVA